MRITLLRHGKPAFELKGYVRGRDLGRLAKSYDLSGIVDSPPRETMMAIQDNQVIVCSDLVRSVESAKALGCSEVHIKDSLFRETEIPHFGSGSVPLPVGVWMIVLRFLWLFGFSRNGESLCQARRRARQAADQLVELAEAHQNVLLIGHGLMNHLIAKELLNSGWFGPEKPGKEFWSYGIYERKPT